MPDLRSELEKVIHAWEQPEQPEFQPTHETIMDTPTAPATPALSVNEKLFNFVKANPGLTAMQIQEHMPNIKHSSLSSQLAQMAKRHLIIKSGGQNETKYGGVFHAAVDKYMSPSEQLGVGRNQRTSVYKSKTKGKAKKAAAKKQSWQADMFTVDTSERPTPPAPKPELTVSSPAPQPAMRSVFDLDIESLTVAEARALRDKLNALFGA